jgi:hypothetical protein
MSDDREVDVATISAWRELDLTCICSPYYTIPHPLPQVVSFAPRLSAPHNLAVPCAEETRSWSATCMRGSHLRVLARQALHCMLKCPGTGQARLASAMVMFARLYRRIGISWRRECADVTWQAQLRVVNGLPTATGIEVRRLGAV